MEISAKKKQAVSSINISSLYREMQMPYDITYMWNLKYGTNEPIYKTETDSQTWRKELWFPGGEGEEVGWTGSLELVDEIIMFRMDRQ